MTRILNRSKVATVVCLVLFCVVVMLPPIIHGYVYPNVGDDTAENLLVFDILKAGETPSSQFILSYKIVGYPIIYVSNLTGLSTDSLFLWFNYVALALIGITIYFVMSRLMTRRVGWLALVITLFCAQGILFQFYYGQIFNAINVGIILPLLLFFVVRYLRQGKPYQFVLALLLGGLFSSFHTSGIYLPFFAGFAVIVYTAYCSLKRRHIQFSYVLLGIGLVVLPSVTFLVLVPGAWGLGYSAIHNIGHAMAVPVGSYLMGIVSPTVLVLSAFLVVYLKDILNNIFGEAKILAVLLCCMVVVLSVATFAKLSLDPFRQALDLATILALLVVVLVSALFWTSKNQVVMLVLLFAIGFGLWHNLPTWFDYNSAIRLADKEAIAYVNTLNRDSYNCSPEVAYWIYDRFTTSKYEEYPNNEGWCAPILIVRDLPMTPRSDSKNKWYKGHGVDTDMYIPLEGDDTFDDDYYLLKSFSDSKVTVKVYENLGNGRIVPLGETK